MRSVSTGRSAVDATTVLGSLLSPEGRRDPYPRYAELHQLGPVSPVAAATGYDTVVCGYDAAVRVLRDTTFRMLDAEYLDRGGTRWREHPALKTLQDSIFFTNGPDHARVRRLFSSVFTPRRVAALEPAIARLTDELLDRMSTMDGPL